MNARRSSSGDRRREHLLELVDSEHEPLAGWRRARASGRSPPRAPASSASGRSPGRTRHDCSPKRRQQAGAQERGLAAAGWPDDRRAACASPSRATSSSTSRSRPKKNSASVGSNGARPLNGQTCRCGDGALPAPGSCGDVQRRVLHEDRPFELLQLDAGLEAQLFVHQRPRVPVDLEPFRLAAAAVEREHQLGAKAFAVRVLGDQRLELGDEREVAAQRELGVDPLLDRRQPELLEPLGLDLREPLELEIGERPP